MRCLRLLKSSARPGVTTEELDRAAEKFIRSQDAEPAFKGYRGYPAATCLSPNDMVVHGIPGPYELAEGDLARAHPSWARSHATTASGSAAVVTLEPRTTTSGATARMSAANVPDG